MGTRRRPLAIASLAVAVALPVTGPAAASTAQERSSFPQNAVLLADRGVAIERETVIHAGSVVLRTAESGPYLTGVPAQGALARDVRLTDPDGVVAANTVRFERGVTLHHLLTNTSDPGGQVLGTTSPLALPVDVSYPETETVEAGTEPIAVPRDTSFHLEPGFYGSAWMLRHPGEAVTYLLTAAQCTERPTSSEAV